MGKTQTQSPDVYSPLPDRYTRIFWLDRGSGPLSGILAPLKLFKSSHSGDEHSPSLVKRAFGRSRDKTHEMFIILAKSAGFDALSYSWTGSSDPVASLALRTYQRTEYDMSAKTLLPKGKVVARRTIGVAEELKRCLLELRRRGHQRWMWVDAICINQDEIRRLEGPPTPALPEYEASEFARHAPLMNDIYGSARNVLIWVGELNDVEDQDLRRLKAVTEQMERLVRAGQNALELQGREATRADVGLPARDESFWTSMASVLSKRWWERLWTLQEAVLAEAGTIIRKTGYTPLDDLLAFGYYANAFGISPTNHAPGGQGTGTQGTPSPDSIRDVHRLQQAFRLYRMDLPQTGSVLHPAISNLAFSQISLQLLLPVVQRRQCSPSHQEDKVYGALGLMSKNSRAQIRVEKGVDPPLVYVAFAVQCIGENEHPGICILNYTHHHPDRLSGLPSWCPDLSTKPLTNPLCEEGYWAGVLREVTWARVKGFNAGFDMEKGWMPKERKWKETEFRTSKVKKKNESYRSDGPMQLQVVEAPQPLGNTTPRWLLKATGVQVDRVIATIPTKEVDPIEWERRCYTLFRKHMPDADLDTYSRTLIANARLTRTSGDGGDVQEVSFIDVGMQNNTSQYYRQAMSSVKNSRKDKGGGNESSASGSQTPEAARYLMALDNFCPGRSFFVTSGGRIGIGPGDMRGADKVGVFFFCPTPYILREEEGRTLFVGEAYVHGLMHGEALSLVDDGRLEMKEWLIE